VAGPVEAAAGEAEPSEDAGFLIQPGGSGAVRRHRGPVLRLTSASSSHR